MKGNLAWTFKICATTKPVKLILQYKGILAEIKPWYSLGWPYENFRCIPEVHDIILWVINSILFFIFWTKIMLIYPFITLTYSTWSIPSKMSKRERSQIGPFPAKPANRICYLTFMEIKRIPLGQWIWIIFLLYLELFTEWTCFIMPGYVCSMLAHIFKILCNKTYCKHFALNKVIHNI